ncbi:MAG TPA: non-ribosomal peptide synthase/polyketide synthase [Thermoanaerobaculia bacterium]|nr:non-ribosomal peptide synthase/polyketide synthase [Thermoanaerobaculia bacterium]
MSDGVSKRMGNLSPEKQALLVLQMKKKKAAEAAAARAAAAAMPRRLDASGPAPLSFAQQRLWLLDRLEPGTTAYNMPAQMRLRGPLDTAALELAIGGILRRHEALRTTFSERDSQPVQVIAPAESFELSIADLTGLPEEVLRAEERRLLAASGRPFDLERGPLFRAALVRLAAGEHLLLLDMHHIVSDGWSFGVFFRELAALYESFHEGQAPSLPELPVQYSDFAVWQREWLQGAVLEEQLAYWRERLAEAPPELELPLDRVRPAVQAHRGRSAHADLPPALTARLRELTLHEGGSPFMIFLAAFQLLLSRLSGQDDVVVGSPSAGRSRGEIEGLIGMFLNTLVLRTSLSGDPTFRELLGRVKEVVLGAYRYQAIPFERLLEELQPERQLSRTPIFQVLFNFVSISNLRMSLSGIEVDLIESGEAESKFDFTLYVNELPDSLRFDLVYNADLFEPERMAEMLRQLEHLLTQAAADPDRRIGEMSLVTPAAAALLPDPAQPLAGEWHGAIHQALSRTAAGHPDRIAVQDAQETVWTYAELEARANRLAQYLISRGVKKGDAVAVWAHRSAPLVQALMGTLKAGAAFMILDPAYPVTRLLDYLRIGRPAAWIALPGAPPPPAEVEEAVSALCRVELGALSSQPETDPDIPIGPDDPACLTFTSGSTGMPKGVVGRHGPLTHFYPWMAERFALSSEDRFGMLSALSHDPLQRDVFTPVWLGGHMVLPDPDWIGAPGYLAGWLRSERVTVLHLTPAMMEMVLESTSNGSEPISGLPDLRWAFVVGDLLKKGDVERLQELAPSAICVNLYGSTETQRSVSYFEVLRHPGLDRLGKEVLPLGRGMEGCQLLVLNRGGGLAGVGESGEIHLRSRHLAHGYLGDEALTAERFRPNPLLASPEAGDRVYRTGDLGRYLPDGGVEFAGRADFQVKLRGFRIELGEVEAALARYPGVRECVVIAREDRPGDRRLVGYLVGSFAPEQHELRAFLGSRLPDYMVPSAFVVLPALPLTRTGKVDRRALPPPAEEQHEADRTVEKSPVEELLAGIWADLLGLTDVAPHQSFFELGGHSLLATRMISRVRAVLGVEMPLRSVFEAPTLAAFAMLAERARQGAKGALVPSLIRVPRSGPLPTSFAQQRLWFLDQLEPGSFAYNLAGAVRLEGSLDVAALSAALSDIVQRHESLRTVFKEEDGEPRQVILNLAPLALAVLDVSALPAQEEEVRLIAAAEARRPYDLSRGPLARFALLRLGEREHVLLVGMHHIVSDGWSMGIFVRELGALYRGDTAVLPKLPIQYADYASWQRQWLSGEVMEDRLAWWKGQLAGAPQVVDLPLDRQRPAVQSYRGGRAYLTISGEVEATARRLGVTPFMALLSGFATLLARYGSQSDVVVGTPIANRGRAELEDLIGFFANTLALRMDLSGDPGFDELARRVREVSLGAYARQDIPFERLVSELQPERDLSHSPVFQVMLALQNLPESQLDLAGLTLSPMELDFGRTQYDLSLFLFPHDGGLLARLEYARDLFDAGTAERLLAHLRNLLAGIPEAAERRLSDLPLLAPEERQELLAAGNLTAAEVPELLLHQFFEAMAAERPDEVAVSFEGEVLTYAGLNASANRLAHHLRRLGIGPESLVAVCLERSPDLLIALLGVLKSGGAYVPLDPTYPAERVSWVLEDSRASVLLTQSSLVEVLPNHGRTIVLEDVDLSGQSRSDMAPMAGPENLAYVLYTSGSTGRPKGVAVRQRGAVNFLASMAQRPGLGADDVLLAVTTIAFDISVLELFLPLSRGARIELAGRETLVDGRRLMERMAESGATVMQATPATWRLLLEAGWEGSSRLKVLCGGEALPPDLARELLARTGEVWNVYGPTETTVWSAVHQVTALDAIGSRPVPLGGAVANTEIYLLGRFERTLEPVPPGAPGELYIGGEGLARGYLGRPDLSAERFVPDPFSGRPGARLYRTGDLVRRRQDGALEFLGRADNQVKIRGFRIELGEIESVLGSHLAVRECAVVVREDVEGAKRLVAYLALEGGDVETLRNELREKLPEYMVPTAFVVLPSLPLTPNGKVDRRALPSPIEERREVELSGERSPVEELLAGIWARVLGVPDVAPHESFFELGGHSLLATRMISRVRTVLGVELPMRAVFEEPTLAGFAALAERARRGDSEDQLVLPLVRVPRSGPLPTSFSQHRLWFLDQLEPGSFAYNLAEAVRLEGSLNVAALAGALSEIVVRHESLRTRFIEQDGEALQVIEDPAPLSLPVVDLSSLAAETLEEEMRHVAGAEARRPYDLSRGPLVRFSLLRLGQGQHVLFFGMHHIVSDGWSMGIFVRELGALYRALTTGEPAALPELPVQYADFAAWQRQWLSGEVMEDRLAWWKWQLSGVPQVLELPLDRPRPAVQSYLGGGRAHLTISRELEARLETVTRRLGVTPFMGLLAGFATLLSRYGSQTDVVVGTPIANRGRAELEDVIGFFANTVPLRVDLSGDPGFDELARRVRAMALGSYAHQDIPFERLVSDLQPERDLSRAPVFQVMLALQNLPDVRLDLADLTLSHLEIDFGRTQFDLSLFLFPEPEQGGLLGWLEYPRDLFDAGTAERLLAHLHNLLVGIVDAPEQRLSELSLLAPEEHRALLAVGNHTAAEVPGCLLHQLFEAMAAERPDAVAVVHEGEILTYAELNASANRVAHLLRRLGVAPESLVAVCLERSPEMLSALLGVLKAGGAYIPLDPTYPAERIAWVLEDSRASVLLTQGSLVDMLPSHGSRRIVLDQTDLSAESEADPTPLAGPESLAYVIYTSGSTGRPKGAAVRQRGAVNFLASMASRPGVGPDDVVLAVTTIAFDISVLELFLPLSRGARIELVGRETACDGFRLKEKLAEVTLAQATPATWRLLLEAGWERSPGLKALCGGEALPPDLARELLARTGELWNVYGPTETTVWSAVHPVAALDAIGSRPLPLGESIANTELYLLSRFEQALQPVPLGAPGELYIGGEGLARGYLGRPELTAERFVPDPFSGRPGARLYRTGDLVRRRQDGALEFLGRVDQQVKIRGFRIELGEIESVLGSHPAVRECAVVVREDVPGAKRLVAYLALEGGDVEALRNQLRDKLPEYMVPTAFVVLPSLPLTPNGKVDRRALPSPVEERREVERSGERSPVEELLAGIWARVLGVPDVAPHESFFKLGGHSLLATRMISRVRAVLGVEMPIRAVFEAPTLAAFAMLAELARQGAEGALVPPLVRVPRSGPLPTSFAQQRLWFLDQLEPGSFAYNLAGAVRLEGTLDVTALSGALIGIVRRHESLRTVFEEENGEPRQVILEPASLPLAVIDLSGLPAREEEVRRIAAAEARRPYDLSRGSLVRSALLRLGEREHALLVGMHHIVSDGWSMGIFVRELGALYAGNVGDTAALPRLPLQYADFAVWQRQCLSGEVMEDRLAWWKDRLGGAPQVIDLPLDHLRPAIQSYRGGRADLAIGRELVGRLEETARSLGVTPFMALLAGFATLLSRYGSQPDVVMGTPVANRSRAELEDLIGFFVNTLALRVDLSGDPGFDDLARRVREMALGGFAHQDVPFERLVSDLRPERSLSHAPVFQVLLAFQNLPDSQLELEGLTLSSLTYDADRTQYDLSLFAFPLPEGGLLARLEYARDLFDAATAERILGHFQTLLEGAVAEPEAPLSQLPLLTAGERAQLAARDQVEHRGHSEGLLHALFESQAQRTPEAVALVAGDAVLTYAELEEKSAQLAARLRSLGIGPETGVAVCLERTADLVVSLLGVLRSGGFYVPLDPRYPAERLRFLVEDSGAKLVLTQDRLGELLAEPEPVSVPKADVTPGNLAYLIYTSGSTGGPKAVAIEHRSAAVFAQWARDAFSPEELRGVLASTAVTFDLSVFELFVTLAWGGTVVLVENALADLPVGIEVTLINTVPSAMAELLRNDSLRGSIRTINLAGEALPRWLADLAYARPETVRLCNLYGPSEDTTYSTWTVVERSTDRAPSIGRPVHDTRAYVLDPGMERLPVGVPGELCLAGAGLARGYLGRPELTAERFVPDPFSTEPGARMYRTGDLARLRADGELDYLGRLDHQVKVRGFRIELGEVEAALARQLGVESAVVLAREDVPGDKRLVAYIVGSTADLRQALKQELPEPMVPSSFVFLDAFPLTPHGKVDRRALPAPQASHEVEASVERSPAEELLAGIWSALLRVSAIGQKDNFFDLGGHSLLATQVVSRVREVFGVELPLRALFETPTLAGLAARIQEARNEDLGLQAPPILALPRDGEVRASFAQERLWFLDRFGTDRASYNIPAAVRLQGWLDVSALTACLTEIVRRHESLRTTFKVTGGAEPRVLQVIAPASDLTLSVADLAGLPDVEREAEVVRLAHEEARRLFDLKTGPLLRAGLARLGEREHMLLLSVHHIVADGWSIGILVRELSALYAAFVQGRPSLLPDLPVQYADFAVWQRAWLQGEVLEAQLGWWRERLTGAPAVIDLAADRPRPAVQSARGGRLGYALPMELSQGMQALVRAEGATLFMALLAGFQLLLARTTGREDLPVGTPIANRNRAETEGLIGFFVNTLVLRGDLAGDPSFRELLGRSREAALGAYAHQDVPFEKLVEELRPERDLSHSPLFQVMVMLQNAPTEALELPDLTIVPQGADSGTTKFDLRLGLMQTPEGLAGSLVYNRDLFDATTVERLGGYLETLLTAAVAYPELPLSELPLLGEAERSQLLQWGDARPTSDGKALLHRLFEAQAASGRTAVTCSGEHLTYQELNVRANRLAHALIACGVRPGDLVGLRLERSLDMVVAVLGVLKAGGAYLPLDPAYPEERLAFAIEDSRVAVVVTQEWLERAEIGHQSSESPAVEVTPDFPAYVIYTSGSTGRPKGVVVTHANAARLFAATDAWFGFGPDDVWTLFHSYAFDFSVWELWGALLYGGRLVVVPYWVSRSPEAFYELVRDERVTVLNQTPSAFRQLVWAEQSILTSLGQAEPDLALRYVVFGGEALELASLAPWYERHADDRPRLVNMYGITETTVHVTYRPLSRKDVEEAHGSVIGVPIPDLSLRVLDRDLRLQPIGVPGEIHVGGEGLALGYLGRPELTAERFVPDPFGPAGARLYRSGDLARYLPDGDVEYLGRIDHQVKIRGFRIELGEIETALTLQPEIREAVVLAREDKPGDKRLVAYLVAERELPAGELRERLKAKLPEYMVPAAFVTLPALPLTSNGKVDRKALPAPEAASLAQKRERVAPRTGLELSLADLWQTALSSSWEVGIEDDFFELGGNSITGAILINRLQEVLGEIVHVVVIFDAPTIERMAAYLIGNHTEAVARVWGEESLGGAVAGRERVERIDIASVEQMRGLVRPLPPLARRGPKNPPAIFVLAPPRSGTTLMRVLLGGHPRLFAPPELELLSYNTLAERKATYTGRDAFWLEGLVRAVMEIRGCTAEEATEIIAGWEKEGWTARRTYGQLQEWLGERSLVDKTPSYALDPAILQRAEEDFEEPLYVHLVRHPYGMIRSFEEAKLDQIFFRQAHPFTRRELAELIWLVSQENILSFLEQVPARRRHLVRFEDLVSDPEPVLRGLCDFLGLDFHLAMLRPYEDRSRRMTDGVYAESRMLGDVKFHTHSGIDASTAERWREAYQEDFLGTPTARMAVALGYEVRAGGASAAIPRRDWQPGEPRPLSFAQQRLWFLDRLEPASYAYNIAGAVRLTGPLNVAALSGALCTIINRHESLRTTFGERDGEPYQVIAEPVPMLLPVLDISGLPAAVREEEARRVATAESRRAFDLARGPLVRFSLLRLGEREHGLALGMHHVISDGWSLGIFVRELGQLYRGGVAGATTALPDLPIQYSDYAAWQREWLSGAAMEERLSWWLWQLGGAPQVIDLPLDRPRPPVQSFRGDRAYLAIGSQVWERLEALARRLGVTPFMALLAGYATLLHRYGSQSEVVVGTPIANRGRGELENLIGFFANTLALRVDMSGDPGFSDLARRVRAVALGAYARQEVPFERLVEELRPERSLSHAPVFQVALALQNLPESDLDLGDVALSRLPVDSGAAQFDLSLFLNPSAQGGMAARMDYASDLFDPGTVERLLGHFLRLLEGVAAEGADGVRLSELPLLSGEEREQVVSEWNRTTAEIPAEPVHHLFRQWGERRPDALAVSWSGGRLSYGELARRVERLACRLRERGVGPETVVALCFERSPELIVATLAVLEAGGAYLPIDPVQPAERLDWILRDSAAALLLTPKTLAAIEEMDAREESFVAEADPDALAYVIYTSGSTGMPKGTELRHRGLSSLMAWQRRSYGLGPEDRNTFLGGPGFDASIWEMWGALASGASLHIPLPEVIPAPAALLRWMVQEGITFSFLPTPLTEAVLSEPLPEGLALRAVIVGGDRLVRRPAPDIPFALFNLYGPTENTIVATAGRVSPYGDRAPDIGTPVANTRTYILDRFLWPVPVGVPGELCLAGEGLARSYRFRPELTADRFVPDSFGGQGERLYRTGDLARWRPDGGIEFLGRVDSQVKIRGFRIELGEVEATLTRQPGVESAVVLAREDGDGEKRLVAYVVGASGGTSVEELRRGLQRTLPEPMLPSAFVFLDAFPLTPQGKVDRRALPAPERSQHGTGAKFIPPRTPLEEEVARVWRDVLKVDRVGVSDSFWELGGHSLLATRVLSRIEELFEVDLPLQTLFASPSLEEFAAMVGERVLVLEGEDIDAALAELNGMSEDEIRALMEQEALESEELE